MLYSSINKSNRANGLLVVFALTASSLFSQTYTLLSSKDSSGIAYSNIAFYSNDSLLGGTYSNSKGRFFVSDTNTEKFSVSHVSYRDTVVDYNPQKVPETLYLSPQNISLKTVTVSDDQTENSNTIYLGLKPPKRKILFWEKEDSRNSVRMILKCDTLLKYPVKEVRLQRGIKNEEKLIKSFVFYSDPIYHEGTNYIVKVLFL